MPLVAGQQIDANYRTVNGNQAFLFKAPWTFVTLTTGATGAHTVFTVTGDWLVSAFGICNTNLAGAGTIELGVAGNTAGLIAQIADAENLDDGDNWVDATPEVGVSAVPGSFILNDGADIILTIGTTAITAGQVDFYLTGRPLENDSAITVTTPA